MNYICNKSLYIVLCLLLVACTNNEEYNETSVSDGRELTGIEAVIDDGEAPTRAGTVTRLANYVGRNKFITDDVIVFTNISRTEAPLDNFVYPGKKGYEGITFKAGTEGAWSRVVKDAAKEPERVYWTDAQNTHTFVAYSKPQDENYDWKQYHPTSGSTKTWYLGSIGDPTKTGGDNVIIDFNNPSDAEDSTALAKEDLLVAYDTNMQAEPGGSVALVKFHHALSSVRVVVNISGFASTSTSADVKTTVSNMRMLHQPTMYVWKQEGVGAQPLNAESAVTDQPMVNTAWTGESIIPLYDQRKTLKLWIPKPEGTGSNQSKTFVFYGITTPQPSDYMSTLTDEKEKYRKTELEFTVTYPDPMKPTTNTLEKTYKASIEGVYYKPGYNTTINVTLNHKDEHMTVGAEYENWQYIATPDIGQLKKNSTFLQDTERTSIYLHNQQVGGKDVIVDDATWLYQLDDPNDASKKIIYDIYGHKGDSEADAYQISTAYQLLAFAYEVNNGMDFANKYVRLDADLTLQSSTKDTQQELLPNEEGVVGTADVTTIEWIGIGDDTHKFNGTFLGGNRFIYRLYGKPLFTKLGSNAKVKKLQVNAIIIGNGDYKAVNGSGLFAEENDGRISGCSVVGNVSLSGTTAGAFVGKNTGALYASYHIGDTKGTTTVGGLVGSNGGIISGCYQAGVVSGTGTKRGIAGTTTDGNNISNTYFCNSLFTYDGISSGVEGRSSAEMTKNGFVTEINSGIATWRTTHADYDNYTYGYQPANYPRLTQ